MLVSFLQNIDEVYIVLELLLFQNSFCQKLMKRSQETKHFCLFINRKNKLLKTISPYKLIFLEITYVLDDCVNFICQFEMVDRICIENGMNFGLCPRCLLSLILPKSEDLAKVLGLHCFHDHSFHFASFAGRRCHFCHPDREVNVHVLSVISPIKKLSLSFLFGCSSRQLHSTCCESAASRDETKIRVCREDQNCQSERDSSSNFGSCSSHHSMHSERQCGQELPLSLSDHSAADCAARGATDVSAAVDKRRCL